MSLKRGEALGFHDPTRSYKFTMLNGQDIVRFAVSFEAIDDLEHVTTKPGKHDEQFERLRAGIEEAAQRKFFGLTEEERQRSEEILLTHGDMSKVPKRFYGRR